MNTRRSFLSAFVAFLFSSLKREIVTSDGVVIEKVGKVTNNGGQWIMENWALNFRNADQHASSMGAHRWAELHLSEPQEIARGNA